MKARGIVSIMDIMKGIEKVRERLIIMIMKKNMDIERENSLKF